MTQESYDRPTDNYDNQLFTIDEQICVKTHAMYIG